MSLAMLRWLTTGYGSDARVTEIVDSREVWIVVRQSDGGKYKPNRTYQNCGRTARRHARRHRQRSTGTTTPWGYQGGTSSDPPQQPLRGVAFSAPRPGMRDFVEPRREVAADPAASASHDGRVFLPIRLQEANARRHAGRHRAAFARLARDGRVSGYRPSRERTLPDGGGLSRLYGRYRVFSFVSNSSPRRRFTAREMIGPYGTPRMPSSPARQAACPYARRQGTTHCGRSSTPRIDRAGGSTTMAPYGRRGAGRGAKPARHRERAEAAGTTKSGRALVTARPPLDRALVRSRRRAER